MVDGSVYMEVYRHGCGVLDLHTSLRNILLGIPVDRVPMSK